MLIRTQIGNGMKLRRKTGNERSATLLAAGKRIYAIGDVHGRLDLLQILIQTIEADNAKRVPAEVTIIILGDFIDRGPDSAAIVRVLIAQSRHRVVTLAGNHEASLLAGLSGDRSALELWIEFGGDATLRSYGGGDEDIHPTDPRNLLPNVRRIIPKQVVKWMKGLPLLYRSGHYLFAHAGIRPGVAITQQDRDDVVWIREEFTASDADHGAIVVHGHTVTDEVCICKNRIGVDTGAYRTGRLSCIGLEANDQWVLDATRAQS